MGQILLQTAGICFASIRVSYSQLDFLEAASITYRIKYFYIVYQSMLQGARIFLEFIRISYSLFGVGQCQKQDLRFLCNMPGSYIFIL